MSPPDAANHSVWRRLHLRLAPSARGAVLAVTATGLASLTCSANRAADLTPAPAIRTGAAAFGDYSGDAPGVRRLIRPADLPAPFASASVARGASVVDPPRGATLHVPEGFRVQRMVAGLSGPRALRTAPNGDLFVAETGAGRIRVIRSSAAGDAVANMSVFASGLAGPFGMAFWPAGPAPEWLYVATRNQVLRFPYRSGNLTARATAEVIVAQLAPSTNGHSTRDLVFTADGQTLLVSVGSASNDAGDLPRKSVAEAARFDAAAGTGAVWGDETRRAAVLAFSPEGKPRTAAFATGLRNCVGLTRQPETGDPWCVVNERDERGDDLVPDYATRIHAGDFFGWPWYYIGAHVDPEHRGERPDLAAKVRVPDVLLQAHSAALGIVFYPSAPTGAAAFPAAMRGDAFVALHGSWNRSRRTGYKIVRLLMQDGKPTGVYEDFLTGFVVDEYRVWGRPVGVAVAADGALIVSDDAGGALWRVSYAPR